MINFGAVPAGSVIPIFFDSFAGATGASITITGLAVTDIEIYKGTSMTQRASDAGYTLLDTDGIDLDTITGIHGFSIDTGDNTDAGFYAAGSFYNVVVSAITVDSQTVNFVAATFRLVAAESIAGTPKADMSALGGVAQSATDLKDFADDGYDPATNKVQGVVLTDTLTTYTGNTVQTGDCYARLGAPAGASIAADLLAIDNFVDGLETTIGTPSGASVSADIAAMKVDTAAILVDTAEIGSAGAGLTALATQASVNTIDDFLDTEIAAIKAKTDSLTFTSAGKVDSNMLAIGGDTTALTAFKQAVLGNVVATVGAASTTTSIVTSSMTPAAGVADQFKGRIVTFDKDTTTAALRGQSTDITASTNVGVLTVTALTTAPASGDTFVIT